MRKLLYAATAICGLAGPAMALPAITGDINFDGNVVYTASTVDIRRQRRGRRPAATAPWLIFGTCNGLHQRGPTSPISPFNGTGEQLPLRAPTARYSFALDLLSVFNVQFVSANDLDFDGNVGACT